MRFKLIGVLIAAALPLAMVNSAHAVHLFPVTPGFDPLGHDCAKDLGEAPAESGGAVIVAGFNFVDTETGSSTTLVEAGETVTWTWLADHCHSVTFDDEDIQGTDGAPGFTPAQPQLVRIGDGDSFAVEFPDPGAYDYFCIHHASVGMRGRVTVTTA